MIKQTTQELTKSKKFGRYDIIYEHLLKYEGEVIFGGDYVEEIALRLNEIKEQHNGEIISIDIFYKPDYFYQDDYKQDFHVKDTTVSVYSCPKNSFFSLSIHHKNINKRQETRKFLEEILS